jgi:AraC family transcriptional regulator of adaptative response/methylated-DNA-[protein]-cysteine methyltransferase
MGLLERLRRGGDRFASALTMGLSRRAASATRSNALGKTPGASEKITCVKTTRIETPSPLVAGATDDGVCPLGFADRRAFQKQIETLRRRIGPSVPGNNRHLEELRRQLDEYFSGLRRDFTVPLVAPGSPFQEEVWDALREIPYGQTWSYDQLARHIGRAGAQRAVGKANGDNRIAILIPCHRVVRNDGTLCGYGGGLWRKQMLLDLESSRGLQSARKSGR